MKKNELIMHKLKGEHSWNLQFQQDPITRSYDHIQTCEICGEQQRYEPDPSLLVFGGGGASGHVGIATGGGGAGGFTFIESDPIDINVKISLEYNET